MIARNYFSHHDPATGEILLGRLPTLVSVGENLFQVSGPAVRFMRNINGEVLKGWQNSPSHNELLLAGNMTRGGLAFARTETRIIAVLIASASELQRSPSRVLDGEGWNGTQIEPICPGSLKESGERAASKARAISSIRCPIYFSL